MHYRLRSIYGLPQAANLVGAGCLRLDKYIKDDCITKKTPIVCTCVHMYASCFCSLASSILAYRVSSSDMLDFGSCGKASFTMMGDHNIIRLLLVLVLVCFTFRRASQFAVHRRAMQPLHHGNCADSNTSILLLNEMALLKSQMTPTYIATTILTSRCITQII